MATSLLMVPNDHQTTKARLPTTQDHQPQPSRRATGRRKAKVCDSSKKKVPQRGMGVEKLEKLRRMAEINNAGQDFNLDPNIPTVLASSPVAQMGFAPYDNGYMGFRGQMLVQDPVQGDTYGIGKKSRDHLSLSANATMCLYDSCTCHKKKKVHVQNFCVGGGINIGYNENIFTQQHQGLVAKPHLVPQMGCVVGNMNEGVGIVAVHRRGSARYGGGASMLMEYEFFPHRRTESPPSSSFSFPVASSSSVDGFHDFNQLDLSLKLSY